MFRLWVMRLCLVTICLAVTVLPAMSGGNKPVLKLDAFSSRERPPARFDHDQHQQYKAVKDCYTCHHVYKDGKLVPGESSDDKGCAECHPVQVKDRGTRLLIAYHKLCQKCHDSQGQGPKACGECHVK